MAATSFLGTNPYITNRGRLNDSWHKLRYDGVNREDTSFQPKVFKSSRDNRINFDRENSRSKALDEFQDDRDSEDSYFRGRVLRIDPDLLTSTKHRSGITLNYYDNEDLVDPEISFGATSLTFRKKRRRIASKTVQFVASKRKYDTPLTAVVESKHKYIHFRLKPVTLGPADYRLLLDNIDFIELPPNVTKKTMKSYLQAPTGKYDRLCSLLLNSFRHDRFTDEETKLDPFTGRQRRTTKPLDIPKGFIDRFYI